MKKLMIMVAALSMVATFAMTAAAADWNFYGNARVFTFIEDMDAPAAGADDKDYIQGLQTNSRIGANIKVSDELSARFEYGTGAAGAEDVRTRLIYGTWNFGAGALTVGQFWTPVNWFFSSQTAWGDNGMLMYGTINNLRQAGLQLQFGGFKIAALQPSSADLTGLGTDTDTSMPKWELSYTMNFDGGHFAKIVGGYNTYEIDAATWSTDVDSWVVGLSGKYVFGAFSLAGGIWTAENQGTYRAGLFTSSRNNLVINNATGALQESEEYGYAIVGTFKLNDMVSFEAGYGYAESELNDADPTTSEDDGGTWYIQAPITFAPGVFIVPEIGEFDNKSNAAGASEAKVLYYGLKWQINF